MFILKIIFYITYYKKIQIPTTFPIIEVLLIKKNTIIKIFYYNHSIYNKIIQNQLLIIFKNKIPF